jgi:hypothetical protein
MGLATFLAPFSKAHLVTLLITQQQMENEEKTCFIKKLNGPRFFLPEAETSKR